MVARHRGGNPLGRSFSVRDFLLGGLAGVLATLLIGGVVLLVLPDGGTAQLEPGELTVLSGRDDSVGRQRQQLIDLWNDSHPHNHAKIIEVNQPANGQYAEMIAQAQNPGIDVFNLDVTLTATFAAPRSGAPWIRPVNESWLVEKPAQAFMANPLATCRYGGKLWALPFNTDAGLLYYRTDIGAAGPFSWDMIKKVADRQLAARKDFSAGYTAQLGQYEGLTVNLLEAVWAGGGDLAVGPAGQVSLDLGKWNAAARLLTPGADRFVSKEALTSNETASTSTFLNGSVMFMRNWPVAYRALRAAGRKLPFSVAALPGPSVLGGQNLAVSARSRKPRAAQALTEFLTSRRSQEILFERGGFAATRQAIYDDEAVKQEIPYAVTLRGAVEKARLRPVTPNYVAFSEVIYRYAYQVIVKQAPALPEDFAAELTAALRGK